MIRIKLQHTISFRFILTITFFIAILLMSWPLEVIRAAPGGPVVTGYLLDEDFSFLYTRYDSNNIPSGWDVEKNGGSFTNYYCNSFKITDSSNTLPVTMSRQFVTQTGGQITLEYRFKQPVRQNGVSWQLRSGTTAGVNILTTGGNLCYVNSSGANTVLQAYNANTEYGVKVVADITAKTANIYVNGVLKVSDVPFNNPTVNNLDNIYIKTGDTATGDMFLTPVKIYKGYLLHEKFLTAMPGTMPNSDWSVSTGGGTANVQLINSSTMPDCHSLVMNDTVTSNNISISKSFPAQSSNTVFEYKVLYPAMADGMCAELKGGAASVVRIQTAGGQLQYQNVSGQWTNLQSYQGNLWYHVKIVAKPLTGKADIYINGKLKAQDAEVSAPGLNSSNVNFYTSSSGTGIMWLDDILVYREEALPSDYVSAPVAPTPAASSYLVGMQSCSIWREGHHNGWDRINPYPERKSYLGYYDEGSPEEADWEIKWLVEHGINYEMFCWYTPPGGALNPIKDPYGGSALHDGYFNAKYSDQLKFTIAWINNASDLTAANAKDTFENNIVPFWMEYYFKDPRYLKIDNKPVISLFNYSGLKSLFGGNAAGVKNEVDFLRAACVNAGFSGAVILSEYGGTDSAAMAELKSAGIDCIYSYTLGMLTGNADFQKTNMQAQRNAAQIDMIPTLSMGRDDSAWGGPVGKYASPGEFQSLAQWSRDTFMPSLPAASLGKNMVLLDNWNEYGEGHFMMPSKLAGFGYLDAVRSIFTAGGAHEDQVPTQTQKDRINILYPADRTLEQVPLASYPIVSPIYKAAWMFNTDGNSEGWSAGVTNITGAAVAGGYYTATSVGTDPLMNSADNLNIDITNSPYIKIRLRNGSSSNEGAVYFTTTTDTVGDETKSVHFFINANDPNYTEYIVEMYKNPKWTGTLKRLRLDPCTAAGQFSIDYIALPDNASLHIGGNMVKDSSFEGAAIPYNNSWKAASQLTNTEFHRGIQSLYVTKSDNYGSIIYDAALQNKTTYYYSAWAKLPYGATQNQVLRLCFDYYVDGVYKSAIIGTSPGLSSAAWSQVYGLYTVDEPGTITGGRFYVYTDLPPLKESYFLDDVELRTVNNFEIGSQRFFKDYQKGTQAEITDAGLMAGNVSAVVDFTNHTTQTQDVVLIIALYEGSNILKQVQYYPYKAAQGEKVTLSGGLDVPDLSKGQYELKQFLWDTLSNRKPFVGGKSLQE